MSADVRLLSRTAAAPRWREMRASDLDTVKALSDLVHSALPERREILADKFTHFPQGAFVLEQGQAVGYALAHPWTLGAIPALDTPLGALPVNADCLYLHDVAILPAARGHGSARMLVDLLAAIAGCLEMQALALTSVYGTREFWRACGFAEQAAPAMAEKLATYGGPAHYMIRTL